MPVRLRRMIREPTEIKIDEYGRIELPLGLLAEAGLSPESSVVAFSHGDGRIVLRRAEDAMRDLIENGTLD
jgi:bifunctional DNA-binding transcriptional regulator/antitoxin component of YhaV-PrlF toxin-antitoxin module